MYDHNYNDGDDDDDHDCHHLHHHDFGDDVGEANNIWDAGDGEKNPDANWKLLNIVSQADINDSQ